MKSIFPSPCHIFTLYKLQKAAGDKTVIQSHHLNGRAALSPVSYNFGEGVLFIQNKYNNIPRRTEHQF